ncbi:M20 aminoacylase family protein [Quisquiliibacterium transsilvanicum]|uniref:Hippurate hydrolase n=1 Tax=Quisquiliibacterium transsilvanicum TaxID=1549638 RepID=A0A7W8HL49_9BURK|nr:M20 aminoacylase family protein [Quisquiliibacterium transsilvanicum]MBB5273411.1 hippurate hydrolase [Quisquiliibacterium transsilvanicum]
MNAPESYLGQHPAIASIRAWHDELTTIRRRLHRNPELGFEEHFTGDLVAAELQRYGVGEIHRGVGRTGLVAVIRGRRDDSGRRIGLRADMDALPMHEENDFEHRSQRPGLMHGCGHDGHTTMLLGAARQLAITRNFDGVAHLIFQPGEEGFGGAQAMIDDGLFERFPCDAVYAMHNWPALPPGTLAVRPGPMMAAADRVTITVEGKGGHGAHAYLAIDPVLVAAHIITAAQSIVSRNVSPIDSAVVSLCSIEAGNSGAMSVIPREARIVGTVRTFRRDTQDMVEQNLSRLCTSIAEGFGARATVQYERIYPATINSRDEALFAQRVAEELVGAHKLVRDLEPSMGSEDFAFMLQKRPGAYFRIGQGTGTGGCFLHNACYDFNDGILPLGAALFVRLIERGMPLPA